MAKYTAPPALKRQWTQLDKKEQRFLAKQYESSPSVINEKLDEYVPDKLRSALDTGFLKAFELIFEKGTGIIEKTYNKEKHQTSFMTNEYAESVNLNRRTLSASSKNSGAAQKKNLLLSGAEGIGMGILGIGLPDIPVFTAMILKGIYETALSYGYDYESEDEQIFILKLIEASVSRGDDLYRSDKAINHFIYTGDPFKTTKKEQMIKTSDSIAAELMCMKFLQTIPVVGVIGGAYDVVFLNRVLKYADFKYQRRRLFSKLTPKEQ